jgi:hypothetical protein
MKIKIILFMLLSTMCIFGCSDENKFSENDLDQKIFSMVQDDLNLSLIEVHLFNLVIFLNPEYDKMAYKESVNLLQGLCNVSNSISFSIHNPSVDFNELENLKICMDPKSDCIPFKTCNNYIYVSVSDRDINSVLVVANTTVKNAISISDCNYDYGKIISLKLVCTNRETCNETYIRQEIVKELKESELCEFTDGSNFKSNFFECIEKLNIHDLFQSSIIRSGDEIIDLCNIEKEFYQEVKKLTSFSYQYDGNTYSTQYPSHYMDSLEWIKSNTEDDSIILSWWDYGHAIRGKTNRKVLVSSPSKEATNFIAKGIWNNDDIKEKGDLSSDENLRFVAKVLINNDEDEIINIANEKNIDYILILKEDIGKMSVIYHIANYDKSISEIENKQEYWANIHKSLDNEDVFIKKALNGNLTKMKVVFNGTNSVLVKT